MTTRYRNPKHHGMHKTEERWMGKHTPKKFFFFLKLLDFGIGFGTRINSLSRVSFPLDYQLALTARMCELGTWTLEISPERTLRNISGYGQNCQCKRMQSGFLGTGLLIPLMANLLVSALFQNFLSIMQNTSAMF